MAGSYEYRNKPSGSMKGQGFFYYINEYKLLKKDSAP
jgi:hypothetical protein